MGTLDASDLLTHVNDKNKTMPMGYMPADKIKTVNEIFKKNLETYKNNTNIETISTVLAGDFVTLNAIPTKDGYKVLRCLDETEMQVYRAAEKKKEKKPKETKKTKTTTKPKTTKKGGDGDSSSDINEKNEITNYDLLNSKVDKLSTLVKEIISGKGNAIRKPGLDI
jgi:hypothetical protein